MDYQTQAALSYYREVESLTRDGSISIVIHTTTKQIYIKKILTSFFLPVYEQLKAHPVYHTPQIVELFPDDTQLIVIEEYIAGETLADIILKNRHLSEEQTVLYALELCDILDGLHSFTPPIVHRDIKPENIMIRMDGSLCLLDFNISKFENRLESEDTRQLGTREYAAPEQFGLAASDIRTDIFAMGKLINTMLTGDPKKKITYDSKLNEIITCATRWQPENRYQDITQLKKALQKLIKSGRYPKTIKDAHTKPVTLNSQITLNTQVTPNAQDSRHYPKRATGTLGIRMANQNQSTESNLMHPEKQKEPSDIQPPLSGLASYLPPGFRSRNPIHYILATAGYALVLYYCIICDYNASSAFYQTLDQIILFLAFFCSILVLGNYRGLRHHVLLHKNPYRLIRIAGIALTVFLIFFIGFLLMALLEI